MSHELRTPLNAIIGSSQLMSRDPGLSARQRQRLTIIDGSGEHLLALINDILDMSKIEAGKEKLTIEAFNLEHMLDHIVGMVRGRAEEKVCGSFSTATGTCRVLSAATSASCARS